MIDGVEVENNQNNVYLCIIRKLSKELKNVIKTNLSKICYGPNKAESELLLYSYKETLNEFLKRYSNKSEATKKGMMGELLSHIIFLEFNSDLNSVSPFFNMEERSIKKGFDLIFIDVNYEDKFWIAEVKTGELGSYSTTREKNNSLLTKAKKDLKNRLNNQDKMIWRNAINGARLANKGNLKEEVVRILEENVDEGIQNEFKSTKENVILTSVIFNDIQDKIELSNIVSKKHKISKENVFNDIMIFSIQKDTYKAIERFLKEEAADE
ncbi:MAG: DUF1837 domain-containing protein [Nanoarchaeota archaeon]